MSPSSCPISPPRRRCTATRSAPRCRSRMPLPAHGVTVGLRRAAKHQDRAAGAARRDSPVRGFLERNPAGGMHHLCYEVDDILAARDRLRAEGARVLGDGEPRLGRARQAGAVPAPQGFLRHADRAGAGLTVGSIMGWVTGIVVYVLIWWVALFAVLPLWVTPTDPDDTGLCRRRAAAAAICC